MLQQYHPCDEAVFEQICGRPPVSMDGSWAEYIFSVPFYFEYKNWLSIKIHFKNFLCTKQRAFFLLYLEKALPLYLSFQKVTPFFLLFHIQICFLPYPIAIKRLYRFPMGFGFYVYPAHKNISSNAFLL